MKIINIVVGIGTTIILASLIVLGIRAFYPEPPYPEYSRYVKPLTPVEFNCAVGDAACMQKKEAYYQEQQAQQEAFDKEEREYRETMKIYNRNMFLIANVIGILVFIAGFLIIFKTNVASIGAPIGVMLAGLWGIFYGYMRGWGSADDQLKFFVGLVIAVLVIGGSMWLMERYRKTHQGA